MGRKVHPIGFRLNVNQDWRGRWFAEGAQYREQLGQDFSIRDMIYQETGRRVSPGLMWSVIQVN